MGLRCDNPHMLSEKKLQESHMEILYRSDKERRRELPPISHCNLLLMPPRHRGEADLD